SSSVLFLLLALAQFHFRLERGQRLVPELIEPTAQRAEPVRVDEVDPPCSFLPVSHKALLLERLEMLRTGRPADRHAPGDAADRSGPRPQALEYASARRIGQGRQHVSVSHSLS